jgi:alpha-tubulin suppressor-like RCC1 family protein
MSLANGGVGAGARLINVFSFGFGGEGQLGLGEEILESSTKRWCQPYPRPLFSIDAVRSAACGVSHSLFLLKSGHVLASGVLDDGRLGSKTRPPVTHPETGEVLPPEHTPFSLRPRGIIWHASPVKVLTPDHHVVHVACGHASSYAVLESGEVFAWGSGRFGCLGLGDEVDRWVPTPLRQFHRNVRATQLAAGKWHCAVVTSQGASYVWGRNSKGQCGLGHVSDSERSPVRHEWGPTQRPAQVACGAEHTLCLVYVTRNGGKSRSAVYGWGAHECGQIGKSRSENYFRPLEVESVTSFLRNARRRVKSVACGGCHSLAILDVTGEVIAWGEGNMGQLGDSFNYNRDSPVFVHGLRQVTHIAAGERHNIVLSKEDHSVWTWGWNNWGECGLGDCSCRLIPHKVEGLSYVKATSVAAGRSQSLVITDGKAMRVCDNPMYAPFFRELSESGIEAMQSLKEQMKLQGLDPVALEFPSAYLPGQPGSVDADCSAQDPQSPFKWCMDAPCPAAADSLLPSTSLAGMGAYMPVYTCSPCGLSWVCLSCARHCHSGHHTTVQFRLRNGKPCDCESIRRGTCRCRWSPAFETFTSLASQEDASISLSEIKVREKVMLLDIQSFFFLIDDVDTFYPAARIATNYGWCSSSTI